LLKKLRENLNEIGLDLEPKKSVWVEFSKFGIRQWISELIIL